MTTVAGDFGVSAPVLGLTLYCETALGSLTQALLPSGEIAIDSGPGRVATVGGDFAVSLPVVGLIVYWETFLAGSPIGPTSTA